MDNYDNFIRNEIVTNEKVLGTNKRIIMMDTIIDVLSYNETIELVEKYVNTKTPLHLMGVNADKINELHKNPKLKEIVNSCGIINADGASVILASKFLDKKLPERVAGVDLMQSLVELSAKKGYSVYLLGAKQEVVEKTANVLQERYQNLNICGIRNGYFDSTQWEEIANELNELNPDFIFVGITSPLKEYLIEYLQNRGNKGVFMGVGGSFDVISGNIARAPVWMQKHNLEWLFRVIQEPRRLFKRYFVGNTVFIISVLNEKLSKR
ncbi:MAG: WecB/TagA/CpsF family glycosyltransferase [Oscillospiraceae bacterium]|nr:WecB/TagA/CpsF family glycosyltransferase [Oscillospiraceae bacterium]